MQDEVKISELNSALLGYSMTKRGVPLVPIYGVPNGFNYGRVLLVFDCKGNRQFDMEEVWSDFINEK